MNSQPVAATAERGVAKAAAPLPHLEQIQASFGHHDVSGVKAAVGGDSAAACQQLGADAYATGNQVAFAESPGLHLAAHEATHVVQQRAGVSLSSDRGKAGDRYEQHADRVADLVVQGKSAEGELDALAGGGATRAVQCHDSPGHVGIGDSIVGDKGITILGVEFSPGECAAYVDYVGPLAEWSQVCQTRQAEETEETKGSTVAALEEMRTMLQTGNEDGLRWDQLTDGRYSELTQGNADHFAPGEGDSAEERGPNHSDTFTSWYAQALMTAGGGDADGGRAHLYTAEHYLQDMFSSGHLVAQVDIDEAVTDVLGTPGLIDAWHARNAGFEIYERGRDTIDMYRYNLPLRPKISKLDFADLFMQYGLFIETESMINGGIRKFVHEGLDIGVPVQSGANPNGWMMYGDHDVDKNAENVEAVQNALIAARDAFDAQVGTAIDEATARALATELLAHHKPEPTTVGKDQIARTLNNATSDLEALFDAVTEAGLDTLAGGMDYLVFEGYFVRIDNPHELKPGPDVPERSRGDECEVPQQ